MSANENKVTAYKAFRADWTCRGYQYAVGETYVHDGPVSLCDSGFHACEVPFDCWFHYPGSTTFAKVELAGVSDARGEDSKRVAASLTISAALTLPQWINEQARVVVKLCKTATGRLAAREEECALADNGHAAATGHRGHAAATGHRGHAAATGHRGHAAVTGDYGHAAATGDYGHAAATGGFGHAAATGHRGHAAATGHRGHAAATGDGGHAAATGHNGHAAATGDYGHAAATGDRGHAAATGDYGHAAATGHRGHAAATGDYGHAAVLGKNAIAASLGADGTARAEAGGAIMLAAYDEQGNLVAVRAARVGEDGVEAGKTYRLTPNGEFEVVL